MVLNGHFGAFLVQHRVTEYSNDVCCTCKKSHRISRVCLGRKQRVESECARAVAKKTQHRVLVGSCCRRGRCGCGVDVGGLCRCLFRAMHLVHHGRTSLHTPNPFYNQIRRLTEMSEAKMWPATSPFRGAEESSRD